MAFGFMNWKSNESKKTINDVAHIKEIEEAIPEMPLVVDTRFGSTITKENLHQSKSILEIVPKEAEWSKISFETVEVGLLINGKEYSEHGVDDVLNQTQSNLLHSTDYSSNIFIKTTGIKPGKDMQPERYSYYLTVVPEHEASYKDGYEQLISYLRKNTDQERLGSNQKMLQPGRILFTINSDGSINNVNLESTSGMSNIDKKLMELITQTSGNWIPAENLHGEKVEQQLVISFGMVGC